MRYAVNIARRGALAATLVAAMLALLSEPASGGPATTVRVTSAEGPSGGRVTVRLEAMDVPEPGLGAFTIDLEYEPGVASPVSCHENPGGILDGALCNTAFSADVVRVGGFRASSGATGGVPLASIEFRLVGQADACGSLVPKLIELVDTKGQPIAGVSVVSGSLCIRGEGAAAENQPSPTSPPQAGSPRPTIEAGPTSAAPGASTGAPAPPTSAPGPSTTGAATASAEQEPAGVTAVAATPPPEGGDPDAKESKAGQGARAGVQTSAEDSDGGGAAPWLAAVVLGGLSLPLGGYAVWRLIRRRRGARP